MKKSNLIAASAMLVLVAGAFVGCGKKQPTPSGPQTTNGARPAPASYELSIAKSDDDPKDVVAFQKVIAKLGTDYRDAQLLTNAVLLTRLEKIKLEDYKKLCDQAIAKWVDVQKDSDGLDPFLKDSPTTLRAPYFRHAASTAAGLLKGAFLIEPAYASEEVQLDMPRWDKVKLVEGIPGVSRLQVVKNVFNASSKEAKDIMEDHYSQEAASWGNWAKGYDIASKTAKTVNTSSKVALFVGGAVITAGGSAVLTLPVGAAVTTGFGASVGVVDGALMTIGGVDMALEVSETTASLAFKDEKTAATYAEARKTIAPVTTLINIYNLKNLEDPSNIYNAYELGTQAGEMADDYFKVEAKDGKATIKSGSRKDFPGAVNADGLLAQLPPGNYLIDRNAPLPPKYPSAEELKAMFPVFGVYRGTASFDMLMMDQTMTVETEIMVTIGKQGDVTYKFWKKGNIPYNMPGANLAMSADYSLDGELKGKMGNDEFTASEGSFLNSAKVNLPAQYASYMPPEALAKLSNTAKGTGTVKGKVEAPGSLVGDISLSANGRTYKGTWQATMQ